MNSKANANEPAQTVLDARSECARAQTRTPDQIRDRCSCFNAAEGCFIVVSSCVDLNNSGHNEKVDHEQAEKMRLRAIAGLDLAIDIAGAAWHLGDGD